MPVRLIVCVLLQRLSVRRCAPAGAGRGAAGGRGIDFDALRAQAAAALTSLQQRAKRARRRVATTAF